MNCGDGGLRACRSGLSGVLEDLYGFLSTSDFQQTEKTEARDKTDALLRVTHNFFRKLTTA